MKTRFWKSAISLMLICMLALSLTGCEELDYREAVELYNAGAYERAAQIFIQLPGYEDSDELYTRCYYWLAVEAMEYGRYDAALEQFTALGDYEDVPERITECKYQLAIAAFDSGDLNTAQQLFLEAPTYRQAEEYCRKINWQHLHTAIKESGTEDDTGFTLSKKDGNLMVNVCASTAEPNQIKLSIGQIKDMGYVFSDALQLTLTRDSTKAVFTAESGFSMDFKGGQIGSNQSGSGIVEITTCNAETVLTLETFSMSVTDNLGKTSESSDPADSLMNDAMAENWKILLETVPGMLADAGITLTLADIGFTALA